MYNLSEILGVNNFLMVPFCIQDLRMQILDEFIFMPRIEWRFSRQPKRFKSKPVFIHTTIALVEVRSSAATAAL